MNCTSQIEDVEVNPADVARVSIRYRLPSTPSPSPPCTAAPPQPAAGVLYFVRVSRMGTVPARHGHLGGEYAMLGSPG